MYSVDFETTNDYFLEKSFVVGICIFCVSDAFVKIKSNKNY